MSELSPSAQAVRDNYGRALFTKQYAASGRIEIAIAAALRAAALNFRTEMKGSVSNDFVRGVLAAATALDEIAFDLEAQ